jgi:hypothetical protein
MKKLLLLCCTIPVLWVSCKKDEERVSMRTEIITKGKWQLAALSASTKAGGETTITDVYLTMPECAKDDLMSFNLDGSVLLEMGELKCDPDAGDTYTGITWDFKDADTQLELTDTAGVHLYDIISLSDTGMVLQVVETVENVRTTTTTRYRHIK